MYSPQLGTAGLAERPNIWEQEAAGRVERPIALEDAQLIEKINAGQTEAYGDLVRKYQDRVFNTCWRICGNLEDARDLTQEAFLKAFESLDTFRRQSGFYTWIYRVAVNLALSHRRSARRRQVLSLDRGAGVEGTQAENLAKRVASGSQDDPARLASATEQQGAVVRALQALDDDHRAVVVLRDIEGFDYREISEVLQIPPGTVKSRLHRARMTLADAIRPSGTSGP
jgi:RNA polymerase sigma-70 factor (ECF subfamily)